MDSELETHRKLLRARANAAEKNWRAPPHDVDERKSRGPKPKRHKLERGEIRRRDQRNERRMLSRPILKGV